MVRALFIIVLISAVSNGMGQEDNRDWRINTTLAFSPGLLTERTQSIQLHGYLGYQKEKIHVRGDGFYLLNQFGDRPRFSMNHQLYFGAFYHFLDKKFQPYIGFQPGVAIAQSSEYAALNEDTGELEYRVATSPVGSPVAGFSFYGEKLFYLFFETRYIFGKHTTNTYPTFLDEWRFSFGLGFHF